jgi:hypothetical protein
MSSRSSAFPEIIPSVARRQNAYVGALERNFLMEPPQNQWATAWLGDHAWKSVAPTSVPNVIEWSYTRGSSTLTQGTE